jgi:hypothetical protein
VRAADDAFASAPSADLAADVAISFALLPLPEACEAAARSAASVGVFAARQGRQQRGIYRERRDDEKPDEPFHAEWGGARTEPGHGKMKRRAAAGNADSGGRRGLSVD